MGKGLPSRKKKIFNWAKGVMVWLIIVAMLADVPLTLYAATTQDAVVEQAESTQEEAAPQATGDGEEVYTSLPSYIYEDYEYEYENYEYEYEDENVLSDDDEQYDDEQYIEDIEDLIQPLDEDLGLEPTEGEFSPDTVLVQLRQQMTRMPAEIVLQQLGVSFTEARSLNPNIDTGQIAPLQLSDPNWSDNVFALTIDTNLYTVEQVLEILNSSPNVEIAEPDFIVQPLNVPNDPRFSDLWGMEAIDALGAWEITTGSRDVVVAVIDSGIQVNHPDFWDGRTGVYRGGNLWENPLYHDRLANCRYSRGRHGFDFVRNTGSLMDHSGHGTHVAGTIGAVGNNGIGVAGVVWNVQIATLRTLGPNGGQASHAIEAINFADRMGMPIINASWGGTYRSEILRNAIANYHGIFIAAAGNSGRNNDVQFSMYPASFDLPNIISVAASDEANDRAEFTNYGRQTVDIAAPGVNVLSTFLNSGYATASGTSMAAPHVAGVAALILSEFPELDPLHVKRAILEGAVPLPQWDDIIWSGALLNARGALEIAATINPNEIAPPTILFGVSTDIDTVELFWNHIPNAVSYNIYINGSATPYRTVMAPQNTLVIRGLQSDTTYTFAVSATTPQENTGRSHEISVTTTTIPATFTAPMRNAINGNQDVETVFRVLTRGANPTVQIGTGLAPMPQMGNAIPMDTAGDLVIPETVTFNGITFTITRIANNAFTGASRRYQRLISGYNMIPEYTNRGIHGLTSVTIPSNITHIGSVAFTGAANLARVEFAENSPISRLEEYMFLNATSLTEVNLPRSLSFIGNSAFNNTNIHTIDFPDTLRIIGADAFRDTFLTHVTLPNSVDTIGSRAFEDTQLTEVVWPNSLRIIGFGAFRNTQLTEAILPNTLFDLQGFAFADTPLAHVVIPGSLGLMGTGVFENTQLTEVVWPNMPRAATTGLYGRIPNSTFRNTPLTHITLPESLERIGMNAFSGTHLTHITLPESLQTIDQSAFRGSHLREIVLPESLTQINMSTFQGTQLTEIVIPNSVQSISMNAFRDTPLRDVTLSESLQTISSSAFQNTQLTEVNFPNSVQSIGMSAFRDTPLTDVVFSNSLQTISQSAFQGTQLTEVIFPNSVYTIGMLAFENISSLEKIVFESTNQTPNLNSNTFRNAAGLRQIISHATVPRNLNANVFTGVSTSRVYLYVPRGTSQAYRAAGWGIFNIRYIEDHVPTAYQIIFHIYDGSNDYVVVDVSPGNTLDLAYLAYRGIPIAHIPGETGAPGRALWGWFTDEQLDASGRMRNDLRRPTVGDVSFDLGTTFTQSVLNNMFDSDGYLNLFVVWSLWGDVDDSGTVAAADATLINQHMFNRMAGEDVYPNAANINLVAADVRLTGTLAAADATRIRQYLFNRMADSPVYPHAVVLGRP